MITPPAYFLLRVTRRGPLVPARLWWCDHGPEDPPDNRLDRGHLSFYQRADIAGTEVDPERLWDRLWSTMDRRPAVSPTHWKYPQPISEAEYRHQLQVLRWAEQHSPSDPRLRPRRDVDPQDVPLPNFDREHSL